MPGQPEEYVRLLAIPALPGPEFRWEDGTAIAADELVDLRALRTYIVTTRAGRDMRRSGAQKRAMRLLKSFLAPAQRDQMRRSRYFLFECPSGNAYRIEPRYGTTEQVSRHGRRWFAVRRFCLHDEQDAGRMPPADLSLAHLLMLADDEAEFLRTANARDARDQLWNGAYLRNLRRARTERPEN